MDASSPTMPAGALQLLARLATATLVVAILSIGRPVLVPIAVAGVLAFLLAPPLRWLQRFLPRLVALALVVGAALGVLGSAAFVLATQLADLTTQLGKYTESMRRKLAALQASAGGPLARVEAMLARVTEGLEKGDAPGVVPVHVVSSDLSPAARLWELVGPLAEPLITVLFVVVLTVFMLAQRDDLRNRLIRLVGPGHVTATTRTLDDASQRITRFLLDQTMINATFGVVVGLGLFFLGIPYAALWGALAALARFIPYLGAIGSMLMPAALAFALFPGWSHTLATVGLFLGMDVITAYAVEPLLIGRRTGVSSIALLVSALAWTWLWGPIGLALATPVTVSLAVLGRHVPALRFLAVVLGDDQVIGMEVSFYQRLLARDEDEAGELALAQLDALGPAGVLDGIIIPTLALAARDRARREITEEDGAFVVTWSGDIAGRLARRGDRTTAAGAPPPPAPAIATAVGVAAPGFGSELLLELLAAALGPGALERVPPASGPAEVLAWVERLAPEVVCVATLPPEGGPSARQLCRELRARFPALTLVAFRPGEPGVEPARAGARLREAGADEVAATLAEATEALARRLRPPAPLAEAG
jgi:predicted PurR-regulated permease PerM